MASDRVLQWCTSPQTVTAELAASTADGQTPADDAFKVAEKLFARRKRDRLLLLSPRGATFRSRRLSNASNTTTGPATPGSPRPASSVLGGSSSSPVGTTHSRQGSAVSTPDTSLHSTFIAPMSPDGKGSLKLLSTISQAADEPASPAAAAGSGGIAPTTTEVTSPTAQADSSLASPSLSVRQEQCDHNGLSQNQYASMSSVSFNSEASSAPANNNPRPSSIASSAGGPGHKRQSSNASSIQSAKNFKRFLEQPITPSALDRAASCGKFKERPSDLFLKIFSGVLTTLHKDPLAGVVSPSLLASTGCIPLSIISVIPDIIRHYADVIRSAEHEVFLATNFWENSHSSREIKDALFELNEKAGKLQRKIVVKIMYDRGNVKQIVDPHQLVPPEIYTGQAVNLPAPKEVPNLSIEVLNFHVFMLGTFHCKYLVVDRRVAVINSNNVQDRCNLEMMCHLEGDIVQSFYDQALLTWRFAMNPPLPLMHHPPQETIFKFGHNHPEVRTKEDLEFAKAAAGVTLNSQNINAHPGLHHSSPRRSNSTTSVASTGTNAMASGPGPIRSLLYPEGGHTNILRAITRRLNTSLQSTKASLAEPTIPLDDFEPHLLHDPHEPVPIAMVNRRPRGSWDYSDLNTPQTAAFMGALLHAEKKVFIQTPTFNAPPVVDGVLDAVQRGVEVTLFLDLGFNDASERLPKQGGTNEQVVSRMFESLASDEQRSRLRIHWYVAKDMATPIHASRKQRNCHIKFMMVDGQVAILGNSNHDSQSWHHSQESNILVDSPRLCEEWMQRLNANQNTARFGKLDNDGLWRNPKDGSVLESKLADPGLIGTIKGFKDTVRRAAGR